PQRPSGVGSGSGLGPDPLGLASPPVPV
ncbi:hypothetical protein BSCA_2559, partial [Bifidobacterium scardovii]